MEVDKWEQIRKKVYEMPKDNFWLLSEIVDSRKNEITTEEIEKTIDEINEALKKLSENFCLIDTAGNELSYPYISFYYDDSNNNHEISIEI